MDMIMSKLRQPNLTVKQDAIDVLRPDIELRTAHCQKTCGFVIFARTLKITKVQNARKEDSKSSRVSDQCAAIRICKIRTLESYKLSDFSDIILHTTPKRTNRSMRSLDGAEGDGNEENIEAETNNEATSEDNDNIEEIDDENTISVSSLSHADLRKRLMIATSIVQGVNKKLGEIYYIHNTPEIAKRSLTRVNRSYQCSLCNYTATTATTAVTFE
ncbi:uncharacterized protein LOC141528935 [Cotesia typhae]|uniref:uncharacterized protein LOC141528935 n=1 Tax=Cotesia typhae TaxID=2053667 RepID=UPI003D685912